MEKQNHLLSPGGLDEKKKLTKSAAQATTHTTWKINKTEDSETTKLWR